MLVKNQLSEVVYPDSDGKPMADNTKQLRWIVVFFGNLSAQYRDDPNVFVAGDLLWYPVERDPETRFAPDVMVVCGRPKGDRGSYKQWEESDVPPTVVFEILSPSNTYVEMDRKWLNYESYGVEEYYLYDPENNHLAAYVRRGEILRRVRPIENHVSPVLGIRFDFSGPVMSVYRRDGQRFLTFEELEEARVQAEQRAELAEQRMKRALSLARKVRLGQATPDELLELERLEVESS